jgi:hypothetical protein
MVDFISKCNTNENEIECDSKSSHSASDDVKKKCIYTTIKHTVKMLQSTMDIRMESILEEMHVNWSIIISSIEKEQNQIKESLENPHNLLESVFKNSDHVKEDKVVEHQQKKDIMVPEGTSSNLIQMAIKARKDLLKLDI